MFWKTSVKKVKKWEQEKNIDKLIKSLKNKDIVIRDAAVEALGRIGKLAVEPLVLALKDEHAWVRWNAAGALGKICEQEKNKTLNNKNIEIQHAVAVALLRIGKLAVEPLILALKDKHKDVRKAAAEALGRTGDTRAVEPLILALKDEDKKVRLYAAKALGKTGDERAVKPLVLALKNKDEDEWVRRDAAEALGKIGDERAVKPLVLALKDEIECVRKEAVRALKKIGTTEALKAIKDHQSSIQKKDMMIIRGGFGEPYCSQECYDNGGKYAAAVMLKNQTGVCGFCQKPVQASMYGDPNCAVIPYEGVNLFICNSCIAQGEAHLKNYKKCCMCQNSL